MKIVVAEDQLVAGLALRRILERLGYETVLATDGLVAWDLLRQGDAQILISGWEMPGMDGPELCRAIRAAGWVRYHYIILVTSRDSREDRIAGLRAGADDFLSKPVDPDELCIRLDIARRILEVHGALDRKNALLAELAMTDPLTGVRNRRRFHEDVDTLVALSSRTGMPLSLIMLDVDHFKRYNDEFGHPAGDDVLRKVAQLLRLNVREQDMVARFGGEEFAVVLPSTSAHEAVAMAERLRATIADHAWPLRPVTASLGAATLNVRRVDAERLVEDADRALYRSKKAGRDRVTHADEPTTADDEPTIVGRLPDGSSLRLVSALDSDPRRLACGLVDSPGLLRGVLFHPPDAPDDAWLQTSWHAVGDFDDWRRCCREPLAVVAGDREAIPFVAWIRLPQIAPALQLDLSRSG